MESSAPTPRQIHAIAGHTGLDPRTIRRVYGLRRDGRITRPVTRAAVIRAATEIGAPPPQQDRA